MENTQKFIIEEDQINQRFDVVLAKLMNKYSRTQISKWIKQGNATLDGEVKKPRDSVQLNQEIIVNIKLEPQLKDYAQAIALDIVYEDDSLLVINKPAGLTVHPGAGQPDGTLLNALLNYNKDLELVPRAGIVHRLDKLTSGLMIISKTIESYYFLVQMLQERLINRKYLAIVQGVPITYFTVEKPIGRHPTVRQKMSVQLFKGKPATTHFKIIKKYRKYSILEATLETGRTHQIRVHLTDAGYPIIGDRVYNKRIVLAKQMDNETINTLQQFARQALHAYQLEFSHPITQEKLAFKSELPIDMKRLKDCLEQDNTSNEPCQGSRY